MEHVSEVAKILEGAIRHDPEQAISYGALLADKLERTGNTRQATLIRNVIRKAPARNADGASLDVVPRRPRDEDSKLATVDVSYPADGGEPWLHLSTRVLAQIEDFASSIEKRDVLQHRGIDIRPRLLLHGEPGTGKSSIARAIAARLGLPLVTTRSDALVSSLLGQTSRNIREVFEYASRWPCVLFLDEFDALGKSRADTREVGELQRVVIALLQNMDAFESAGVLVAATNHPQLLDTAVWRRFDHVIQTESPGESQREAIFRDVLGFLAPNDKDIHRLAQLADGLSGAGVRAAASDIARAEVLAESESLHLAAAARRLARFMLPDTLSRSGSFDSDSEILALRTWAPDIFTYRNLADLFGISTRQVTNHLKEHHGGLPTHTPPAI
ncbi:AAA family ATPase [Homoserinibacter gongjuensis]|uniref:AAA family ATPase n=1 Tax=Homoserinibacter gongjuensis TaxID=1162968 RepID=UPI0024E06313|nr:ATP-binding protein [Homoserinibacter gongjuensis]